MVSHDDKRKRRNGGGPPGKVKMKGDFQPGWQELLAPALGFK
jgi:hypothetical protein